ncbi:MAG: hypothetical protein QM626_10785 [Microbacterium sp.]|uniref:hypothetical protein n=1 Tax=Microbacterium sp. TaxID=51671 RepID=UPI0039E22E0B
MTRAVRRSLAVIGVGAGLVLLLTGCGSSSTGTTADLPTAAPLASDLGFDAGSELTAGTIVQWSDPFASDDAFTAVAASEDGSSWGYTDSSTSCTLGFWQGDLDGVDTASGDSAASDALLAAETGTTVADIEDYVESDVADFVSGSSLISARSLLGADSERGTIYVVSARAFTVLGEGLIASLECPSGIDVLDQWQSYLENEGAFAAYFLGGS